MRNVEEVELVSSSAVHVTIIGIITGGVVQ